MSGFAPVGSTPVGALPEATASAAAMSESPDVMAAAGGIEQPGTMAVTLANDTMAASGGVAAAGVHTTQVVRRSLVQTLAEARTTTLVRRALVKDGGIPIHVTNVVRRALVKEEVPLKVTQFIRRALVAEVPCVTRWTRIWRITRADGTVYRLTSHDMDLVYAGSTWTHCGSLTPSATEGSNESGGIGNTELKGSISLTGISATDLMAGKMDGATFEELEVPWDGSPVTPKLIQRGSWGRVEFSEDTGFSVEVTGDGAKLQQASIVQVYAPGCRWTDNISDARCPVDAEARRVTGTVEDGLAARSFLDSTRTEDADYFAFGLVTFTSGANDGVTVEIQGNVDGVFTLWPKLAVPPAAGDTYSMIPGCDQLKPTCITKFDALIGFGGFDDVPGQDALSESPNAH